MEHGPAQGRRLQHVLPPMGHEAAPHKNHVRETIEALQLSDGIHDQGPGGVHLLAPCPQFRQELTTHTLARQIGEDGAAALGMARDQDNAGAGVGSAEGLGDETLFGVVRETGIPSYPPRGPPETPPSPSFMRQGKVFG